jgi:hypothetical protein
VSIQPEFPVLRWIAQAMVIAKHMKNAAAAIAANIVEPRRVLGKERSSNGG